MQQTTKLHSKLGIASCVIGLVMFVIFLIATLFYYLQFQKIIEGSLGDSVGFLQLMAETVLPIPIHAIGLILGVVALFFPNRKKLFPIIGVISNLIFGLISLFPWLYIIVGSMGRV
jgi:hypothetical protein